MDWFQMLDQFQINNDHPEKLQTGANLFAYTFIYEPLFALTNTEKNIDLLQESYQLVEDAIFAKLSILFHGNVIRKALIFKTLSSNAKKISFLRDAKMVDISFDKLVDIASKMHLHQISDDDLHTLSKVTTQLLLDNSPLQLSITNNIPFDEHTLQVLTSSCADRLFTAFTISLEHRDEIQSAYEKSTTEHGNVFE